MGRDDVEQHEIRDLIQQILNFETSDVLAARITDLAEDNVWHKEHIFQNIRILQSRILETPSIFTSIEGLNQLLNNVRNITDSISQFVSDGNIEYLRSASRVVDSGIIPLLWTFANYQQNGSEVVREAIDSLVSNQARAVAAAESRQRQIEDEFAALEERLTSGIKSFDERAESSISAVGERIGNIEREFISGRDNLLSRILEREVEFNQKLAGLEEQIKIEQQKSIVLSAQLEADYTKFESTARSNFEESLGSMGGRFEEIMAEKLTSANSLIEDIDKLNKDAQSVVAVIGSSGVTASYNRTAEQEAKTAGVLRLFTVLLFLFGIYLASKSYLLHLDNPDFKYSYIDIFFRIVTPIAIVLPAFYTARESARHRTNADRARQREMELASLRPFIALLSDEKKNAITEALTQKYFGAEVEPHELKSVVDLGGVRQLVEAIGEAIAKAIKMRS